MVAHKDFRVDFGYVVLAASVLLMVLGWGASYVIVVSLKSIAQEFGWPRAVPSLAISFLFIGSGFGGVVMGYLLDRTDMGKPALVGAAMIGGGMLTVSVIDAAWQLQLIYGVMIGAFGVGSLSAPLMANIIRWFEHRRGMAVGVVASGQALAGIIWPPILGFTLGEIGWRDSFFWYGVVALCVMVPLAFVVARRPPAPATGVAGATARKIPAPSRPLRPRNMQIALSCAIVGCCVAMSLPLGHLVSYATDLGHPIRDAVQIMSVMLLTAFLTSSIGVGLLADRFGGLRSLIAFSGLQAASLAAFTAVDGLAALYVVAAIFGLGYGGIFPVYAVIVREHMPARESGQRTGQVYLFGAIGMGLGSWMGGAVFDATGSYVPAFLIGVGFNLANVALIVVLSMRTGSMIGRPAPA